MGVLVFLTFDSVVFPLKLRAVIVLSINLTLFVPGEFLRAEPHFPAQIQPAAS